MEYKLFDDYISLQALLKEVGIIPTGGAVKLFLQEETVLLNGQEEKRRGKKIYPGDCLSLPSKNLEIKLRTPDKEEREQYQAQQEEKQRLAKLVKEMNKNLKTKTKPNKGPAKDRQKPVRFPGT
ncbi:RNA-binding S4 domain-containing protein [Streptococcus oricebi]|uniref:S4 domain-containing protein YaaA n=1 Tax=Streptococcus oricebi TaxID=1547447 RepID=A0ABS5B5L0_9STRE|nr:RNA-binding S4 domain-containing protein [Streptococcus oricebi]MBP2624121.1 hypothetical protein [Streptococcus oricebi]